MPDPQTLLEQVAVLEQEYGEWPKVRMLCVKLREVVEVLERIEGGEQVFPVTILGALTPMKEP